MLPRCVAAGKLTNSLRQRTKRTRAALYREKRRHLQNATADDSDAVATITRRMELMTLDSGDREAALRRQLIVLQQAMASRRQRRTTSQYDGHGAMATRAFFRRMSGRFSRPRVVGAAGNPTTSITAMQLASDWKPIVQQQPTTAAARQDFFARLQPVATAPSVDETFEDFTEAEVLQAIAACPAGKASGPDGIPNDWYKPVASGMATVMATTFTSWVRQGQLPRSFTEATIFCLPKVSAPRNGLDFRPISLLNTDYKIFSRLVLQRVQRLVASKVSQAQFGFIARRQVHDAIDVWDALQARVSKGELPATATAVMLDFAKAYDTLDRAFLRQALEFHGFPPLLVAVVDAMHLATTARFLADGDMSDVVDIHNGIRQGCPLAPVLFVLALDLLYKAAELDEHLSGLRLAPSVTVTLCGYANDTTAYLPHPAEEPALLRLLASFGAASGLCINVPKSRAVVLHPEGPKAVHTGMQIPVMSATDLLRLLGMAVASAPSATAIWARTLQQVRATLHMANVKTTNLLQRVTICKAVIMPKLLFVGRHAWPSGKIFDQLQRFLHQFAWHATIAEAGRPGRAWMSSSVASLPVSHGGLGLPDVRTAFLAMSKATVERWSQSSNTVAGAAGAVLRRLVGGGPATRFTGPSRSPLQHHNLQTTLAATGHIALRSAHATPRTAEEQEALEPLLPTTGRGRRDEKWWEDGWLHCRYDAHATTLNSSDAFSIDSTEHSAFKCSLVTRSDFPVLLKDAVTIGDVVEIQWRGPRHLRFRSRQHAWPLSPRIVEQFRRYCDTLVHNYPALLFPHNAPDELQPRPASASVWRLRRDSNGLMLVHEPVVDARVDVGVVHTMAEAIKLARTKDVALLRFDPHPLLDEYAPLWTRQVPATARVSPPVRPQQARALQEVTGRARQALMADAVIGAALSTVSWHTAARLPESSSSQSLLLHKIKGLRLSGWDRRSSRRGCPHCSSTRTADQGHTFHIMWSCDAAQALWCQLQRGWARLGVTFEATATAFCTAIFSLRLRQTPSTAWAFLGMNGIDADLIPQVHQLMETIWQQQVLSCFQQIWRWRHGVDDDALPWTLAVASSALRGAFRHTYYKASQTLKVPRAHELALRRMLHGLAELQLDAEPAVPVDLNPGAASEQHLLFFDGGSRGNPGPGGSGTVLVRVDAFGGRPYLMWAAATSLAHTTTTNNQAEYLGLVTGVVRGAASWTSSAR